jgi:hypothetical protein
LLSDSGGFVICFAKEKKRRELNDTFTALLAFNDVLPLEEMLETSFNDFKS